MTTASFSQILTDASAAEQKAILADRGGRIPEALECYELCIRKLNQALSLCPLNHPDGEAIEQHVSEVNNRIVYLSSLSNTARPLIPLESHISPVQLSVSPPSSISTSTTMGAAAAIGGVGGLLLLGPFGLVAGAAGAAYAATRDDKVGSATRGVAQGSVAMVGKAADVDREHHFTAKAKELGSAAMSKASELNEKYEVTERVKAAGSEAGRRLSEFNERYKVTDKLASGISSGMTTLSNFLQGEKNPPPHEQYQSF